MVVFGNKLVVQINFFFFFNLMRIREKGKVEGKKEAANAEECERDVFTIRTEMPKFDYYF